VFSRLVFLTSLLTGCPSPRSPVPPVGSVTLEIGRDGYGLRGVAGDSRGVYSALTSFTDHPQSVIECRRDQRTVWTVPIDGTAGPLARAGGLLAVALGGSKAAGLELRGAPGAVVMALDATSGTPAWKLAIDSSEWSVITSLAPVGDGLLVGGSFAGTLRATDQIVTSAGRLDGFVARVSAKGTVDWLIRVGGANADAITGVTATADGGRIAITGSFATGAELQGEPLVATDDKSPTSDVFVAELDGAGKRKWSASFGGKLDDLSVGVAIDGRGRLAVAATVRDHLKIDVFDLTVSGPTDGLIVYFDKAGSPGPAIPLGGEALDGLQAITAAGDRIVIGGFYAGTLKIGNQTITASGDDAFLAAFDGAQVTGVWPVAGDGREEIAALSRVPNGFVAGIGHTAAAKFDGETLASPKEPASGAALLVRGVR